MSLTVHGDHSTPCRWTLNWEPISIKSNCLAKYCHRIYPQQVHNHNHALTVAGGEDVWTELQIAVSDPSLCHHHHNKHHDHHQHNHQDADQRVGLHLYPQRSTNLPCLVLSCLVWSCLSLDGRLNNPSQNKSQFHTAWAAGWTGWICVTSHVSLI